MADIIVLAGNVGLEQSIKKAGLILKFLLLRAEETQHKIKQILILLKF